jgi:hypothetical protein
MPWRCKRFFILSLIAAVALNVSAPEQQQNGAYIRSQYFHLTTLETVVQVSDDVEAAIASFGD